jgi:hypothetical protein
MQEEQRVDNMLNCEVRFLATTVNCYTEDEVLIIGMGNDPVSPDHYLILSRFNDGEVDKSIGIQTHLTEMEISSAINSIVLKANILTIAINKHKVDEVKVKKIVVEFGQIDQTLLIKYINDIFLNSSVKVMINR